jgi:hypothetical protein
MEGMKRWVIGLLLAGLCLGCAPFWASVREQERGHAAKNAEMRIARGDCRGAIPSLERAQATRELGLYAAASTLSKAQCLERMGEREQSRAHYRLLRDFYSDFRAERVAHEFGEMDRSLELALGEAPALGGLQALKLEKPRYSPYADRSQLGGPVLVRFWVAENGSIRDIRVLDMPHPLLASWAIEAVAKSKLAKDAVVNLPRAVVTRFVFQTHTDRLNERDAG